MHYRPACLLLILFIAGCGKEPPVKPAPRALVGHLNIDSLPQPQYHANRSFPAPWPMIKTEMLTDTSNNIYYTTTYYYDEIWRLSKLERTGSSSAYGEYTYAPGVVQVNGSTYLWLNGQGLAAYQPYMPGDPYQYSFNGSGNLIDEHHNYSGISYDYNGSHNNYKQHSWIEAYPGHINSDALFYYNTKQNTIGNDNRGMYYMGKSSVNLIDRNEVESINTSQGELHKSFGIYNYTYNDSGWVSHLDMLVGRIKDVQIDSVTTITDTLYYLRQYDYTYY